MDVDVVATVISPDAVTAPIGGERAAVVYVEALKGDAVVGTMILGDLLRLRWDGGELEFLVRHATFAFTSLYAPPPPIAKVPAELVPLLQRGATAFRERLIRQGDRLRLRRRGESQIQLDEVLTFG